MTLCQYYDLKVKEMGFKNFNVFCARYTGDISFLKKRWKAEYKLAKGLVEVKEGVFK